jgi:hypothetical protein
LIAILDERERRRIKSFMDTLNVISKIGVENTGILKMSEDRSHIFMTPETAKGLQLIDKGRLVEERGAPAYVVMGNVESYAGDWVTRSIRRRGEPAFR